MRYTTWLLFIALFISSCDKTKVYEDVSSLPEAYWLADSSKSFEFNIEDPSLSYNLYFNIRNGLEYPHNNIYVNYIVSDSANNVLDEELRNFQLFNSKTGYPLGNGSGNIFEHQFDLLVDYTFPFAGKFNLNIQQYMRYDSLPEVYSVGVRIERVQ
jgi:gliding motility-associated lipoprotein GldH